MPEKIVSVERDGIAGQLGVRPGDYLISINGREVRDLIDYQAFTCARSLRLLTARDDEEIEYAFQKDMYEPLGLGFERGLMSRQRDCVNKCVFCFVDQLPKNVRATMRVKDDDWRMSLMMGNFVTLTNVSDRELERIIERRCAPLYISVHATDPIVRERLLRSNNAGKIMAQLTKLRDAHLSFHAQAVICPGINDAAVLERTIEDLIGLYPAVRSLALVPVGLTGHREGLTDLSPFTPEDARRVLDSAQCWREKCMRELGTAFVFPADEMYLLAGREFPTDAQYEEYPQIENGVGLCRLLETQMRDAYETMAHASDTPRAIAIACGVSVSPYLEKLVRAYPIANTRVTVYPIKNDFFGETVTVSGLLTGGALVRQLPRLTADCLLISDAMLREQEDVFLDDMTLDALAQTLGVPVKPIRDGGALLRAISGEERV